MSDTPLSDKPIGPGPGAASTGAGPTGTPIEPTRSGLPPAAEAEVRARKKVSAPPVDRVRFCGHPKLLFAYPLLLMSPLLWVLSKWGIGPEALGWISVIITAVVVLVMGVDLSRNQVVFVAIFILMMWFLIAWLNTKGVQFFGSIGHWISNIHPMYDPGFWKAVLVLMFIPFIVMLIMARLNDFWEFTNNDFEHYVFGQASMSLGRGEKTLRTEYPDVLEFILAMSGTLVIYDATGQRQLARIEHVPLLPFLHMRLQKLLGTLNVMVGDADPSDAPR